MEEVKKVGILGRVEEVGKKREMGWKRHCVW